jgi:hypothetical protein
MRKRRVRPAQRSADWPTVRARLTPPVPRPARVPVEHDHAGVAEWLAEHGEGGPPSGPACVPPA